MRNRLPMTDLAKRLRLPLEQVSAMEAGKADIPEEVVSYMLRFADD